MFCEKLCVDISFSKETLKTIVSSNLTNFSKDFKNVLERYLDFLSLKSREVAPNLLFKGSTLLSKEEQENIALFFKSLGRLDVSCQVADINNFKNKFLNFQSNADEENKKFGSLSLKLMLLFGALVVIILI